MCRKEECGAIENDPEMKEGLKRTIIENYKKKFIFGNITKNHVIRQR